ncbi:MAG: hypothetical protein D6717_09830 [Gammaproteobacteria bacterium]|nr:MAG: hypothetical protein D6717_09830 [Gammaproteobacteria bacterium]
MSELLDQSICYRRTLPLAARRLQVAPPAEVVERMNRRNEALLLMLESLEAAQPEGEDAHGHESSPELQRLERKLDLALDLLFELLSDRLDRPQTVPVCFNEYAVQWQDGHGFPEGAWVEVDLYLHPLLPRAVKLLGQVTDGTRCEICLEGLNDTVRNLLSRFIFRQHRREVARQRSAQ